MTALKLPYSQTMEHEDYYDSSPLRDIINITTNMYKCVPLKVKEFGTGNFNKDKTLDTIIEA